MWQSGLVLTPLARGLAVRMNPDSHEHLYFRGVRLLTDDEAIFGCFDSAQHDRGEEIVPPRRDCGASSDKSGFVMTMSAS